MDNDFSLQLFTLIETPIKRNITCTGPKCWVSREDRSQYSVLLNYDEVQKLRFSNQPESVIVNIQLGKEMVNKNWVSLKCLEKKR